MILRALQQNVVGFDRRKTLACGVAVGTLVPWQPLIAAFRLITDN